MRDSFQFDRHAHRTPIRPRARNRQVKSRKSAACLALSCTFDLTTDTLKHDLLFVNECFWSDRFDAEVKILTIQQCVLTNTESPATHIGQCQFSRQSQIVCQSTSHAHLRPVSHGTCCCYTPSIFPARLTSLVSTVPALMRQTEIHSEVAT